MPKVPHIDAYSLSSIAVDQYFDQTSLGSATAFIWERRGTLYLITNWHVVTCRNSEAGSHLIPHAGEPNALIGHFRERIGSFEIQRQRIPLRDFENQPLWLHHPAYRRGTDVVALPLTNEFRGFASPINKLSEDALSIQVGMDVYVLGFPFGSKPPALPVWKRGSIASEPEIVGLAEKYYLVDTASRPGMSGSPVILRSYGVHLTDRGPSIATAPGSKFLGIYSGRLQTKEDEAQLGRVWPASLITEIIDANTRDPGN